MYAEIDAGHMTSFASRTWTNLARAEGDDLRIDTFWMDGATFDAKTSTVFSAGTRSMFSTRKSSAQAFADGTQRRLSFEKFMCTRHK